MQLRARHSSVQNVLIASRVPGIQFKPLTVAYEASRHQIPPAPSHSAHGSNGTASETLLGEFPPTAKVPLLQRVFQPFIYRPALWALYPWSLRRPCFVIHFP